MTRAGKKYLYGAVAIALGLLAIGNIRIDAPEGLRGTLEAQGRVTNCEFRGLGRYSSQYFMGLTLDTPSTPYLRFNGPTKERKNYEAMCSRKPVVHVYYHAVKRVFGPVRFWIDRISEA
ncbi:hypothetical protein GCM10027084_28890 [Pseudoxanthomonas sangjuensis]